MRTCMEGCEQLQAADVSSACLQAEFVMLSGYCLYGPGFTQEVIEMAHQARDRCTRVFACECMKRYVYPACECMHGRLADTGPRGEHCYLYRPPPRSSSTWRPLRSSGGSAQKYGTSSTVATCMPCLAMLMSGGPSAMASKRRPQTRPTGPSLGIRALCLRRTGASFSAASWPSPPGVASGVLRWSARARSTAALLWHSST